VGSGLRKRPTCLWRDQESSEAFRAVAVIADEPERVALYERFTAAYPQAGDHQAQTARQIPVVILTRRQAVTPTVSP
jgi:hypothetical protein